MHTLFVVLTLVLFASTANAKEIASIDDQIDSISSAVSTLPRPKFATSTVKPWGYVDAQGDERGLLVHFQEELRLESGVGYDNHIQPYPRVLHSLASGAVDFAVIFDSHASIEKAVRVGDVVAVEIIVVGRSDAQPLSSIKGLQGMNVGYIRGSKYGSIFDEASHFNRIPINNMKQGLAMLLSGRLDAMTSTDQSLYWSMDNLDIDASRLTKMLSIGSTTGGLYMSGKSLRSDLLPIYRKALRRMESKGTMARIFYQAETWVLLDKSSVIPNQQ